MYVKEIALLIFEGIVFTFHISLLIVLIVKRKTQFSGPFYNMTRLLFISDVLVVVISFGHRIPKYGLLQEYFERDRIIISFSIHFSSYLSVLQFMIHGLIPFNRFTLFWFPMKYIKIWSKPWYTVLTIFIPAIILSPTFSAICKMMYNKDVIIVAYENPQASNLNLTILISHCTTFTIFAAIFNFFAFIKYCYQKENFLNSNKTNEISMLYVSCLTFFAHLFFCLIMIFRMFFVGDSVVQNLIVDIWVFSADFIALSGSLSLVILSKSTRKTYVKFYLKFVMAETAVKVKPLTPQFKQSDVVIVE